MATFKDRDVFEYCEKLYEQFKKIDNGYYPHKHDDAVFQQVANHFAIKKKDVIGKIALVVCGVLVHDSFQRSDHIHIFKFLHGLHLQFL